MKWPTAATWSVKVRVLRMSWEFGAAVMHLDMPWHAMLCHAIPMCDSGEELIMLGVFIVWCLAFQRVKQNIIFTCFLLAMSCESAQVFIVISSFMMLNMLLGILVEVVANTAEGSELCLHCMLLQSKRLLDLLSHSEGCGIFVSLIGKCFCQAKRTRKRTLLSDRQEGKCPLAKPFVFLVTPSRSLLIALDLGNGCYPQWLGRGKRYFETEIHVGLWAWQWALWHCVCCHRFRHVWNASGSERCNQQKL